MINVGDKVRWRQLKTVSDSERKKRGVDTTEEYVVVRIIGDDIYELKSDFIDGVFAAEEELIKIED